MPRVKQRRPRRVRALQGTRTSTFAWKGNRKKAPYRKWKKRRMNNKLRPIVEGKMRDQQLQILGDGSNTLDMPDPTNESTWNLSSPGSDPTTMKANDHFEKWENNGFRLIPLYAFTSMNQGLHSDAMIGRNLYSRYVNLKLELKLPGYASLETTINFPFEMFIIHGWVTSPTSYTNLTSPAEADVTRKNINDYIESQIQQYFDTRKDRLAFIPKRTNNLKILGYKRIKANRNKQLNNPMPSVISNGNIYNTSQLAPINLKCSFRTMRKVHYTGGDPTATNDYTSNFYPNNQWLPFVCLYCPQFSDFENQPAKNPIFRYNVSHYYTDA